MQGLCLPEGENQYNIFVGFISLYGKKVWDGITFYFQKAHALAPNYRITGLHAHQQTSKMPTLRA